MLRFVESKIANGELNVYFECAGCNAWGNGKSRDDSKRLEHEADCRYKPDTSESEARRRLAEQACDEAWEKSR